MWAEDRAVVAIGSPLPGPGEAVPERLGIRKGTPCGWMQGRSRCLAPWWEHGWISAPAHSVPLCSAQPVQLSTVALVMFNNHPLR